MADTLAQAIKKKYPGVYDDMTDQQLEEATTARYPGVYDDMPRTPEAAEPAAPAESRPGLARGFARGFGRQTVDIVKGIPGMVQGLAESLTVEGRIKQAIALGEAIQEGGAAGGIEAVTGFPLTGDMPASERAGAAAANLLAMFAPVKGLKRVPGARATRGVGRGVTVEPTTRLRPFFSRQPALKKTVTAPLRELTPDVGVPKVIEDVIAATTKKSGDLTPRLVRQPEAPKVPARVSAMSRAIERAIREGVDVKEAARRRRLRGGRVVPSTRLSAEDVVRQALEEAGRPETPELVSLPPPEPAPMPRTGARGVAVEEPGGALGIVQESGYKGPVDPEAVAAARRARSKAIDEIAQAKMDDLRGGAEIRYDPTVPRTTVAGAYARGATPAEAALEAARVRAEQTAAATAAPLPTAAATAAPKGKLPPAAPKGKLVQALDREKALKALAAFKPKDSRLAQAVTRFNYLSRLEELNPAQTKEVAVLTGRIKGHAETPPRIKKGIDRLHGVLEESRIRPQEPLGMRPTGEGIVPEPAAAMVPEPLSVRSERIATALAPEAAPASRAIPPEATAQAIVQSLGAKYGRTGLTPLIERMQASLPAMQKLAAEGAPEAAPSPAAQALADALNEFVAGPAGEVPASTQIGVRPPPAPSVRIPAYARGAVELPAGRTPLMSRAAEVRKMREILTRFQATQRAKPVAQPEVARVTSPQDVRAAAAPAPRAAPARTAGKPESPLERARKAAELQETGRTIGPPPPGVEPELWARVNAVEAEARALKQERDIVDPRLIDELAQFWGTEEAAHRAGLIPEGASKSTRKAAIDLVTEITGTNRRVPITKVLADTEARFRHLIDDPSGFMRLEALAAGSGAAAGGLLGATIGGEDPMDLVADTLSMAAIGGALAYGGARGMQTLARRPGGRKLLPRTKAGAQYAIEAADTANMLVGPAALKASLGALGGVASGLWEKLSTGDVAAARRGFKMIANPGRNGMVGKYLEAWKKPVDQLRSGPYTQTVAGKLGYPEDTKLTYIARQALRPFTAADEAASAVLREMGYSEAESARMMLAGEPTSYLGQTVLNAVNNSFALRMLIKFPRVRIASFERGIEYMPGLNRYLNMRSRASEVPRMAYKSPFREAEPLSPAQLSARGRLGAAGMLAGTAYGYLQDPGLAELGITAAIAGPMALPVTSAMGVGKAIRAGQGASDIFDEAILPVLRSVPQIQEADVRQLKQRLIPFRSARRAIEEIYGEKRQERPGQRRQREQRERRARERRERRERQ